MHIQRTSGSELDYENERLKKLRALLIKKEINNIHLLHDNEGLLTIVWITKPTLFQKASVALIWSDVFEEDEIEHQLYNNIYL